MASVKPAPESMRQLSSIPVRRRGGTLITRPPGPLYDEEHVHVTRTKPVPTNVKHMPATRLVATGLALSIVACGPGDQQSGQPESSAAVASTATAGEQLYQRCAICHQLDGKGTPGTFRPLAGSEYATHSNVTVPIRIMLHGIEGPLTARGEQISGLMPAYGLGMEMSDDEVAAVLTYVRSSWGNTAGAITPQDVARVRSAARARTGAVTAEELKGM